MSKYGLPRNHKIEWQKADATRHDDSWDLVLRVKGEFVSILVRVEEVRPGQEYSAIKFMRGDEPTRFMIRWTNVPEAKAGLEVWLAAHPEHWQQFINQE